MKWPEKRQVLYHRIQNLGDRSNLAHGRVSAADAALAIARCADTGAGLAAGDTLSAGDGIARADG